MSPLPPGRLRPFQPVPFGRYTLLTPLSTGGMGELFLARLEGPSGFEKLCVIKKILPHLAAEPDFVERFVHEAKVLVKLSHGSIAHVLEMGIQDDSPYMAIEFVDGKDLRKVAGRLRDRREKVPLTFSLYAMAKVLDALGYAHRKRDEDDSDLQLVHRDISPQNVLISYEGEVKVIDFGLAKSALNATRTHPSLILGKFLYMSPEQARHQTVDRRSDLYAVGLCLYELIAGRHPFDDVPPGELMVVVGEPTIPPLRQVAKDCPGEVETAVMRALAVDPDARFQTAEEFRARLLSALYEIDPLAGAEHTSRFMRALFESEYQSERKLLLSARELARQTPDALAEATRRSTLTSFPALSDEHRPTPAAGHFALEEPRDTPVQGNLALAAEPAIPRPPLPPPPRPRAGFEDTAPRSRPPVFEDTAPRIGRLPGFEDTAPRAQVDEPTLPRVGVMFDDLLTLGAHDETQPAVRAPLPESEKTQPALLRPTTPAELESAQAAARIAALPDPPARLPISQRPTVLLPAIRDVPPQAPFFGPPMAEISGITDGEKKSSAARWIWLAIALLVLGVGGYFGLGLSRDGAVHGWLLHLPAPLRHLLRVADPQPTPPPPANPNGARPAAKSGGTAAPGTHAPPSATATGEDDTDLLQPLAGSKAARAGPRRKLSPLEREWAQTRTAFEALNRTTPCEAGDMAMLCVRFRAIAVDVERAGRDGPPELLERVRALRRGIEQKSRR